MNDEIASIFSIKIVILLNYSGAQVTEPIQPIDFQRYCLEVHDPTWRYSVEID